MMVEIRYDANRCQRDAIDSVVELSTEVDRLGGPRWFSVDETWCVVRGGSRFVGRHD